MMDAFLPLEATHLAAEGILFLLAALTTMMSFVLNVK
jgi:hypothetical protein